MKNHSPLVVGNWKLNPVTVKAATDLAGSLAKKLKNLTETQVSVAPPFPYLLEVKKRLTKSPIGLAAQNVSTNNIGAYTGEVSVLQLKDLGVSTIIIGHSERRAMGETDEAVNQKVALTLKHQLCPIVCIGERRRDEQGNFFSFVEDQLRSLASELSSLQIKKVVIAYEPIWAIGTGVNATPGDVKEMQLFIESVLTKIYDRPTARKVQLLYGGSVNPKNAAQLSQEGGMHGFLVGGASLKADDFVDIIKAINI